MRVGGVVLAHEQAQVVAFLDDGVRGRDDAGAEAPEVGDAYAGRFLELGDPAADPRDRRVDLVEANLAGLVTPRRFGAGGHEPAKHLVRGPRDRRHGGYAEAF